ncbi:MAG: hypothetical protein H6975_04365 [Gammaproteobacteria bacterium]|nr:hypothetical protein [Gammaproteobacteria bacterium]
MLTLRARHLGHNPAGGAMILILLLSLTVTIVAILVYGADRNGARWLSIAEQRRQQPH